MDEIEKQVLKEIQRKNNEGLSDFEGYSPAEMQVVLYEPFHKQSPIQFNKLEGQQYFKIPLFSQFKFVLDLLAKEKELKLTTRGYFSIKTVASIYDQGFMKDDSIERGISKLYNEEGVPVIHLTRLLLELSGLAKKRSNKMSLTKKGWAILDDHHQIFMILFETFTNKFNWAYFDGYDDEEIGQLGFGFSLILLDTYGKNFKKTDYYAEKYIKAFGIGENEERPEKAYALRTFDRFLDYFGLVELNDNGLLKFKDVKKTKLFNQLIKIKPHKANFLINME